MPDGDLDGLIAKLDDELGDGPRVVATGDLDEATYELDHIRDDLTEVYDEEIADQFFDDALSERYFGIGGPYTDAVGEQDHTIRFFEACISVIRWLPGRAVFVEIERDEQDRLPDVLDLVEQAV